MLGNIFSDPTTATCHTTLHVDTEPSKVVKNVRVTVTQSESRESPYSLLSFPGP